MNTKVHKPNGKLNTLPFLFGSSETSFPSIDSFKIRIPRDRIKIVNDILNDEFMVVSKTTSEVIEDENFKKSSYFHETNGIKTYYRLEKQIDRNGFVIEYLTILVTSKILESEYFSGINSTTVDTVYSNLVSHKIVDFSMDSFLQGECTDMDIKVDLIPSKPAIKIINNLYECAIPRRQAHQAASVYRQKSNLGIQFALRKTKSFKKFPYLKFYEKIRELTSKSAEFNNTYLDEFELPKEILRAETTIKNKKHFKQLGQTETKLCDILLNLEKVAERAFKTAFEAHLGGYQELPVETNGKELKPMDKILIGLIEEKMISGNSFKAAKHLIVTAYCTNKKQTYRMNKKMDSLSSHIDFSKYLESETKGNFNAWYSQVLERIQYN